MKTKFFAFSALALCMVGAAHAVQIVNVSTDLHGGDAFSETYSFLVGPGTVLTATASTQDVANSYDDDAGNAVNLMSSMDQQLVSLFAVNAPDALDSFTYGSVAKSSSISLMAGQYFYKLQAHNSGNFPGLLSFSVDAVEPAVSQNAPEIDEPYPSLGQPGFPNILTMPSVNIGDALETLPVAAVPEPQTYALLLGGLGVMGFVARRRRPV